MSDVPGMTFHAVTVTAADGHVLAARVYLPQTAPRRAVLLTTAMGVPQRFYEAFATWLASQGVAVMSFDWRGMGDSAPPRLRGYRASITDWATQDLPAVADAFCARWPDVPRTYLGHSLGGQLFGWMPDPQRFERVLTVAAGNGYWRLNAPALRKKAHFLWWVLVPLSIAVAGYFPGKRLGAVGDLPAGAMWQWRRWCLHPDYLGAEGHGVRAGAHAHHGRGDGGRRVAQPRRHPQPVPPVCASPGALRAPAPPPRRVAPRGTPWLFQIIVCVDPVASCLAVDRGMILVSPLSAFKGNCHV
jgi:predicted alpha/beta hydrolase